MRSGSQVEVQSTILPRPSLQPGVLLTRHVTIDRPRTIGFMGEEGRVYATPSMILDIEHTCHELVLQHADAGEDSVGVEVAIKHLAARAGHDGEDPR